MKTTKYTLALTLTLAATGVSLTPVQAAETLRIGAFVSATGPASFLGDPELKTLELYIKEINAQGGVLGQQVELVHYDDGGSAGKARTYVNRLIGADKVDMIIGGSTTGTTMAAVPLVEQAQVPFISMAGAIVITDPVKKWVFKTPQTDRMAATKVLQDMKARGMTKIGLISGTGGFGRSGHKHTLEVAKEMGIEIVADETYGPQDTDMTAQLTKIKSTPGVQAVFNFGFGQGPAIVTKNYAQLAIDLPLYQSHGVASDKYIELAGDAAEGVRLPASPLLVADTLPETDPQKPVVTAYKAKFEAAYNMPVSTFGAYAYDALMLAVDALERAGSTDKAKVRDALEQTQNYVGVTGVYNLSAQDHMGLDVSSFRLLEVSQGTWKLVE
ncbi:branched-chain amino acid transport system substrate-binding protein [Allopseudospirillum japonicum]|uniref:Branched-chain amino acid transport system substrate-binding protein n=1 Tax=Allopseudospirillum japonicum TaxID=64971 RepID=A0A1H6SSA0_9GAMM|nr:ABC transporter substrate-binding protein [Allopseudospirillum japonicum]SEI70763.1 branched-chain amino acid transport system substrate-binding protein [Allopseudospirillum japonicum]